MILTTQFGLLYKDVIEHRNPRQVEGIRTTRHGEAHSGATVPIKGTLHCRGSDQQYHCTHGGMNGGGVVVWDKSED